MGKTPNQGEDGPNQGEDAAPGTARPPAKPPSAHP
jgi:hypothetical protein